MLSDLVRFYNQLCELTATTAKQSTDIELQKITQVAQNYPELETVRQSVLDSFDRFETEFDQIKTQIHDQIKKEEQPYLQNSYKHYEEFRSYRYSWYQYRDPSEYVENVLNSRLPVLDQSCELIRNRIMRYSGWKNTTMILRPGVESWIQSMVSNDPLYLVDENYDLLTPAVLQFNETYQRRLRLYAIREDLDIDQDILWQLPDNQFGLILAWNYFNHRPFEIIRRYLTEFYKKLHPGGILLMTYNDCNRWQGVKSAEAKTGLYTPGSLIQDFAYSLGFEQIYRYHDHGPWTWIEFRKPGEWESLRGGQPLAKILPKPVAKSK